MEARSTEQAAAALAAGRPPPLLVLVRDDSLLLTLNLLQQLQQLRGAGATAAVLAASSSGTSRRSSSSRSGAAAPTPNLAAAAKAEYALELTIDFLSGDLEAALLESCQGAGRDSAPFWPSCPTGRPAVPPSAGAANPEQQAAVPAGPACMEEQAAAAAAAAELVAVWQLHAGAIYTAVEGFVRAQNSSMPPDTQELVQRIAGVCCVNSLGRPHLLLALAQAGSSEHQVPFTTCWCHC